MGRRPCFNEAAARCRGKHLLSPAAALDDRRVASMRPRPDAAENDRRDPRGGGECRASMRPRPDAAENAPHRAGVRGAVGASMRPRPDAAENGTTQEWIWTRKSFNEAAARCRGKPDRRGGKRHHGHHASMRPRPDAAENEAVALGRLDLPAASMRPRPDAAENVRGAAAGQGAAAASMRPRPDAAENSPQRAYAPERLAASMRPRPDAAENRHVAGAPLQTAQGLQ